MRIRKNSNASMMVTRSRSSEEGEAMVYTGEYNAEENAYVFNVTGKKVFDDMQSGKLTLLNIEYDNTPYSILLIAGYSETVESVTTYEFYIEPSTKTALNVESVFAEDDDNLSIVITK